MKSILRRTLNGGSVTAVSRGLKRIIRRRARLFAMVVVVSMLVASLPASSANTQGLRQFNGSGQSISLPAQVYRSVSQSVASIGSWVAGMFSSTSPKTIAYEPVAAYISPAPPFIDAPSNLSVTAASASSVSLSWTAPGGSVDHYQVERATNIEGPFFFLANVSGATTTHSDNTVTNLHAYLYRVRAVTSGGLPSAPSNMALGTAISFQFNELDTQEIKAQHFHDVRTAINLVRALGNLSGATWARSNLVGLDVLADDVNELRTRLNEALTALSIPVTAYQDPTLQTGASGTWIHSTHLEQLQARSTKGSSTSSGPIDSDSSTARLDPLNETGGGGENPLSRNFNWNLPLVSLPGRAGVNLGLSLSYNSLVWTKSGNTISFDDDNGFPAPGFRLGFPVIQQLYYNTEVGKLAFLLISPDGSRTELRQVGSSTLYEAADSSHLLLDSGTMVLRTTDGTQLTYVQMGNEFNCTQIKDRNGNYITVNYTVGGRIDTVVDTLARSIKFNYDVNGWLTSITQIWNEDQPSEVTHNWARFEYADVSIDYNFGSMAVFGLADNSMLKMLSRVKLADDSYFDFSYTSWGQVWKVSSFASDNHLLNHRSYNLPQTGGTAHTDCPRFTERRDWAQYWNGDTNGTTASNEEAVTTFAVPVSDTWTMPDSSPKTGTRAQVTMPDGTSNKIYFIGAAATSSGWQRSLPALVNTYDSGSTLQRQVMTTWTQDNTSVSYKLNPRVIETNAYDPAGNRARTETTYQQFTFANGTSCQLPRDFYEYAANATTKLRSTRTDYNTSTTYTDRRIIGLISETRLHDGDVNSGGVLMSKVAFSYDGSGSIQGTDAPVQHDNTNYTASFVAGRGNLSSVKRHDVTSSAFTTTSSKYNTAGALVSSKDALNHEATISYADSFSDNTSRNTLAYPTTVTDPDGYSSTSKYHFDFGAVTYRRTPEPNVTTNTAGPELTFTFDTLGRLDEITNAVNAASTRFVYTVNDNRVDTYRNIQAGLGEARSFAIVDGHGRVIGSAEEHPSVGGYSGRRVIYDVMGRVFKASNPTETSATGAPSEWTAEGDDEAAGWIYTEQTYDWKGRPLVTTNQNGTTKTASYSGCGCAGGNVVTLTDEGTISSGVAKKRQQKIYSDVLGRSVKTEILNWEGGTVYSATVNTHDARDQITLIRQYSGTEGSGTFQDTTMTYDGFGRLQTRKVPEQSVGTATTWTYNSDDTVNSITDSRGASQTFTYNARHLATGITYAAPGGITVPSSVTYSYDAAGNQTLMTDGHGSQTYQYDLLSRLTQETRQFAVGTFSIGYTYNLVGQLMSVTDPFNDSISYTRNVKGQLKTVAGSPYAGTSSYITDVNYRAWGAPKSVNYPGTTATIAYNSRLLPTEYRHTTNSNGSSVMREDYGYFADGELASLTDLDDTAGSNPPVTLRFLSRSYAYDQLSRITGSGGTGSGSMPGVPYSQSYSYDAFGNMTSRVGAYYNYSQAQPSTDTATFINNRRTNWSYNAEGEVVSTPFTSTDQPRTMTYDAAGRMLTTVETGQNNTITYSASYDGDGQLVFESTNTSPGTSESSYVIRSTVLGGEVLTRLDQSGNKKITHVPAEGLLFATQRSSGAPGAFVQFTHRNPTGTSETNKAVYDPLGNYIPFQAHGDPRPPTGSFTSASLGGLSASQANPFSSAVGCLKDGLPTTCDRVSKAINRGEAKKVIVDGRGQNPNVALGNLGWFLVEYDKNERRHPGRPRKWGPGQRPKTEENAAYDAGKEEGANWVFRLVSFQRQNIGLSEPKVPKVNEDRLRQCARDLFGVDLAYFEQSNVGKSGFFIGNGPDKVRNGGNNATITVVNDVQSFNQAALTNLAGRPAIGVAVPEGVALGRPDNPVTFDPYTNYTSNQIKDPWELMGIQIHELGNSLEFITEVTMDRTQPPGNGGDVDAGVRFERCVFNGRQYSWGK